MVYFKETNPLSIVHLEFRQNAKLLLDNAIVPNLFPLFPCLRPAKKADHGAWSRLGLRLNLPRGIFQRKKSIWGLLPPDPCEPFIPAASMTVFWFLPHNADGVPYWRQDPIYFPDAQD